MRVEVTIDKTRPLPAGAIEALTGELGKRVNRQFPDAVVQVRYAGANGLSVLGGAKTDRSDRGNPSGNPGKRGRVVQRRITLQCCFCRGRSPAFLFLAPCPFIAYPYFGTKSASAL